MWKATGGQGEHEVEGDTVKACLEALIDAYPEARPRLFDEDGQIHYYLTISVGGRVVQLLHTPVEPDDEIVIVPALSGGR